MPEIYYRKKWKKYVAWHIIENNTNFTSLKSDKRDTPPPPPPKKD